MQDLSPGQISKSLKPRIIGKKIFYFPVLHSTMDTARELAREGVEEGTVIIAGEQTAGRGRLKRTWRSPEGNIALSIILQPNIASLPYLIMITSLAAARSIETVTGQKTQIKWPNDVLIDGKKVCGILIENEFNGNQVAFSVIGIGINTGLKVAGFRDIADTAVSLNPVPDTDLRLKVLKELLREFEALYLTLPDGKTIFKDWRRRLITLGQNVKATWGNQVIEGIAEDVDETGALYIRDEGGKVRKVVAGDVTLKK
jgi:BirA family transcriptional regulator, biotin operon repressor / biotin---[acetyl-CoA-carboxylase] ligase